MTTDKRMDLDHRRLLTDMRIAQQRMSKKNDHRAVLHRAELALIALLQEKLEHSEPVEATNAQQTA